MVFDFQGEYVQQRISILANDTIWNDDYIHDTWDS